MKEEWRGYMEDYNTGTMPHEKSVSAAPICLSWSPHAWPMRHLGLTIKFHVQVLQLDAVRNEDCRRQAEEAGKAVEEADEAGSQGGNQHV